MKKTLFILPLLALTACDKSNASNIDIIHNAMDACGDECAIVLTVGERGDFLIRIPESDALREIASGEKNSKFLSTEQPKNFAQTGFCLVNVIPYNTFKEMGTPDNNCHYRIYCGAPEHMNYDEYYAVEVCG